MASFAAQLETEAQHCRKLRCASGSRVGKSARLAERSFTRLLALLGPRITRLTQRYGLMDMREDAGQACAIAIHRALLSYDPAKARFTTHVTWAMRGELQSLRHRMRLDQRAPQSAKAGSSARGVKLRTVSLDALPNDADDLLDEASEGRVEAETRSFMARQYLDSVLEEAGQAADERSLVHAHIFDLPVPRAFSDRTAEQRRQIIRRNIRHCIRVAG
jgi:RNA polymerase sigma-32 factor